MYVRPPKSSMSQRISVPENYGGNTFSPGGLYNDMPPPTRSIPPQADKEQRAAISDYPYGDSSQSHIAPPYFHPQNAREDNITSLGLFFRSCHVPKKNRGDSSTPLFYCLCRICSFLCLGNLKILCRYLR